jgi:hypothetical protein
VYAACAYERATAVQCCYHPFLSTPLASSFAASSSKMILHHDVNLSDTHSLALVVNFTPFTLARASGDDIKKRDDHHHHHLERLKKK